VEISLHKIRVDVSACTLRQQMYIRETYPRLWLVISEEPSL